MHGHQLLQRNGGSPFAPHIHRYLANRGLAMKAQEAKPKYIVHVTQVVGST